ncbi:LOW QUALITY PROTEIN: reverse transcriptase [Phytophthora megakarya]|uniref:Reverse transcriptase n=1 Tax=Phytophthora megakarya TaxID=4795 RepID=A0A225X4A7_9STRA|nr:LOW QUALITY PROTEIN: reverse transcriptase [Phytophthora megakarya]
MSDVFQAFAVMMQSRSRATLSYRAQAYGQQEKHLKTSFQFYGEDPLQQDWNKIVQHLVFAINTSIDTPGKRLPFIWSMDWMRSQL